VRSSEELGEVRRLQALGLNDSEIAGQTAVPRSTVRAWRHAARRDEIGGPACDACGSPEHVPSALPARDYSYLLGLYFGDGCIVGFPRRVYRLTVTLDLRYPAIILGCAAAMREVIGKRPGFNPSVGCVHVNTYSKQWPCLLPQHGRGPKHERPIRLVTWQCEIVERHPGALLRGLIHSDGWRGMNRVVVGGRRYAYPRYNFCNASADIRQIFCDACDAVGVEWRQMNARNISVARRASVARLDRFVGPKR
jgi:hypothetical protein